MKTFISKANGSQSWIDHFLVSEKMEVIIRNVKVLEDVVGSDHQPLILHLEMEAHERGRKDKSNNKLFLRLYWKGLSAQMKQMYSWEITEVLNNSPTPEVFGCKKEYCENEVHRKDIKGLCNYLTEIMKQVEKIWQKQKEANLEIGLWQDGEK